MKVYIVECRRINRYARAFDATYYTVNVLSDQKTANILTDALNKRDRGLIEYRVTEWMVM